MELLLHPAIILVNKMNRCTFWFSLQPKVAPPKIHYKSSMNKLGLVLHTFLFKEHVLFLFNDNYS